MARKALANVKLEKVNKEDKELQLKELVNSFGPDKEQYDKFKKSCDEQNKQIKALCKELKIQDAEIDGWNLNYKVIDKSYFDEEKLLSVIRSYWAEHNGSMQCPYIRTVMCVDNEALEDAIYNDKLDKDILLQIQNCKIPKEEERLTIKRSKEAKK